MTKPPVAPRVEKEIVSHGIKRVDPYFWLREKENPKTKEYIEKENSYAADFFDQHEDLSKELFDEIKSRIPENKDSVPFFQEGYHYYYRYKAGLEYPIYCRKKSSLNASEEIYFDQNIFAKDHDYLSIGDLSISPDQKILAYSVDTSGDRQYKIYFKNLYSAEPIKDVLENTSGSVEWMADSKRVLYVTMDKETFREDRLLVHGLGLPQSQSQEVYFEEDETFNISISVSASRKHIYLVSSQTTQTEYHLIDRNAQVIKTKRMLPRQKDHLYYLDDDGKHSYVRTDLDAPNYRLVRAPIGFESVDAWEEVVAVSADRLLQDFDIFDDAIILEEKVMGLDQVQVLNKSDYKPKFEMNFGGELDQVVIGTNPEMSAGFLRVGFDSMTQPYCVYDIDLKTGEKTLRKQNEVVGGYDASAYESKRLWVPSRDGVKIPVSLVYKKPLKLDSENKFLLYAYGSYGLNISPSFSSHRLSLLDRGFVFAIAHVRGSQTLGRDWYDQGKLLNKQNTFNDFIDCGQHLVDQGYTKPSKLFAQGGSAGGLLMGVIMNQAPELFCGVIAGVPFVDVINTMEDATIPLTTFEYDEWGNPADKEYFDYMMSYSPYDQVSDRDYPNLLIQTGFHDSQVQYWEPTKWLAKLRHHKKCNQKFYMLMNMNVGHGGKSGRYAHIDEVVQKFIFLLHSERT